MLILKKNVLYSYITMRKRREIFISILFIYLFAPQLYARESDLVGSRDEAMFVALDRLEKNIYPQEKGLMDAPEGDKTLSPPIQRGAWGLKKGQLYTEIYSKYYWHKYGFDAKGHKQRWAYGGEYYEIRREIKLEYGLTDRFTLMLSSPYKEAHWKDDFGKSTQKGFVEIWPGIKYLLFNEPFVCSLQARAKFPLHYDEHATPALGRHQIDGEIKILTGQSWPYLPGYTKLEFGFRGRNEEPANEIPYFFELGYNLNPRLILKTTIDGQKGLAHRGQIVEDWVKGTFGPIIKITDVLNLEFGYGNTFAGKNSGASQEGYLAVSSLW